LKRDRQELDQSDRLERRDLKSRVTSWVDGSGVDPGSGNVPEARDLRLGVRAATVAFGFRKGSDGFAGSSGLLALDLLNPILLVAPGDFEVRLALLVPLCWDGTLEDEDVEERRERGSTISGSVGATGVCSSFLEASWS